MLVIRADGNETVGMGHIMRCLSIADAYQALGEEVIFVSADEKMQELLEQRGYRQIVLRTDFENMEAELPALREKLTTKLVASDQSFVYLIDSYRVTQTYLQKIKELFPKCERVVMDDLFSFDYESEVVINYNMYGEAYPFKRQGQLLLTGPSFVPLRQQFLDKIASKNLTQKAPFEKKRILISTGGSDSKHIAEAMVKAIMNQEQPMENYELHVVCGKMNPNKEALLTLQRQYEGKVVVHVDVTDMAGLMEQCDMAIAAAGSTVYELCAMGIPFAVYYFVDNQAKIADYCGNRIGICNAGNYVERKDALLKDCIDEMQKLSTKPEYYRDIQKKIQTVVDGKGAQRIAMALQNLCKES